MRIRILLNRFNDINKFIQIVTKFSSDINIYTRRYILDAKSIMALLNIDFSYPVDVEIISNDKNEIREFKKALEMFVVC